MKAERLAELKAYNPKPTDLVDWAKVNTVLFEDYPELVAEVERLQNKLALHKVGKRNSDAMIAYKDEEIARLRKALGFYADMANHRIDWYDVLSTVGMDFGKIAREATQNGD